MGSLGPRIRVQPLSEEPRLLKMAEEAEATSAKITTLPSGDGRVVDYSLPTKFLITFGFLFFGESSFFGQMRKERRFPVARRRFRYCGE